jgi:TatD DNase family protein
LTSSIIDTHAHLDMSEFDPDREMVIERAFTGGVAAIVTIGIDLESCRRTIALAQKHPRIFAGIGIHPQNAGGVTRADIDQLERLAVQPRVVAIGELGLDYLRDYAPRPQQLQVLRWELELAQKMGLPVVIHCRQAQETILPELQAWCRSYPLPPGQPRGILHNFRDEFDIAQQYLEMGFYLSIGAYLGYPTSVRLCAALGRVPLDKILIETDCPFLPPQDLRGQRNEPSYVPATVRKLAEIKGITPEEVARQTTASAIKVFKLSLP